MIRHRCRALIRDSDSDLPRNSHPLTFLSLSREIRDEIYDLALVSTSPIIVWKGEWKSDYHYYPETEGMIPFSSRLSSVIHWQEVDYEATSASLQPLAANLILCNKTVSHEAARVFYTKNTFCFLGQHNWDPIVPWLESIGPTNRSSLSSIEISAGRPDPAWQCQNGERVADSDGWTRGEIYPLHPYLQLCTTEGRPRCGRVQNINPAVERIFVLLGQNTSEQKLRVVMQLDGCVYPGARILSYAHDPMPEVSWYGMDLPNIIEKSRSLHTQQVDVLWKGKECRKELEDQQAIMESIGWVVNVLPDAEDELHPNPEYHGCHPATDEWRIAKYVLRRKEVTELLWQDICPLPHICQPNICRMSCN
jgi:hypothetical protein